VTRTYYYFPIGFVYISTASTNPAVYFGYGTWSAVAAGKMLVGISVGDSDFGTPAQTGGAKTGTPTGSNSAPTFTGSALAAHAHELPFKKASGATGALSMIPQSVFGNGTNRASESVSAAPTNSTTSSAVALSESKTAGTPAGTVSAPTFTGVAMSVLPPYLVVYMFVRTA
jgi:hypothetical protein